MAGKWAVMNEYGGIILGARPVGWMPRVGIDKLTCHIEKNSIKQ
jgi:hypothetical protein